MLDLSTGPVGLCFSGILLNSSAVSSLLAVRRRQNEPKRKSAGYLVSKSMPSPRIISRMSCWFLQKEIAAHPEKMISVRVDDETDESGEPVVRVDYIGEREMPKDWKPPHA